MATINFECKKSKVNKNGKSPILIRISSGNKRAYIQTDIRISPNQWNHGRQTVRKFKNKLQNSDELNAQLSAIETNALKILKKNPDRNAQELKKLILNSESVKTESTEINLLTFATQQNDLIKNQSYNYYKRRNTAINHLAEQTKGRGIEISKITKSWISQYYTYLTVNKKQKNNTAVKNIRVLSQFFNILIKEDLTQIRNPFETVKFKQEKTYKQKLTKQELNQIKDLNLKENSLIWHVRNYFFAQIYLAGCRFSDLALLQKGNITKSRVSYTMLKTVEHHSVIITEPLREIIDLYIEMYPKRKSLFPLLKKDIDQYPNHRELSLEINRKTSLCNKYLNKIRLQADIEKKITTHIARHTFADLARQEGWNLYDISKALNHSSLKITETYLAELDTSGMDKGMKSLFG